MMGSVETRLACATLVCAFILQCVSHSTSLDLDKQNVARVLRTQIGTLYDLRSKLNRPSSNSAPAQSQSSSSRRSEKEARGYSFHYNPTDISHPLFGANYASQDFHSRMGKVAEPSALNMGQKDVKEKKHSKSTEKEKNYEKYAKLAYKTHVNGKEQHITNSFNIHQNDSYDTKDKESSSKNSNSKVPAFSVAPFSSSSSSTVSPSTSLAPSTSKPEAGKTSSSGFDISRLATIGLGLNEAMTSVLTQKLMNMIDQEVPSGILNPLKHLVSSGNRMVEYWDKRANARDGKPPGIVEMLGYGLEQLKKYRDGQSMKASDPIANITSASKTLIQGMLTVKKLTNRVLGYDTDEVQVESRGGYGHDSYGGGGYGHHVSYGGIGGLDPFALLAALAFGAFLLQLLLTLLNTSARSLDVVDLNTPLILSDFHVPSFMTKMDKIFGTPTTRSKRSLGEDENPMFNSVIDKLDGMYKTYKVVSKKPSCARLYLCRLALQDQDQDQSSFTSKLYMYGMEHLAGDKEATDFVNSINDRMSRGEEIDCFKEVPSCSPKDEE